MKFVHMADMHFDMPFTILNKKGNFGTIRRLDQREAFRKIITYIKENEIPYFFISGDFYEHNYIRKSTIEYVNNLFKEIPNTRIFIAPGNHDPYIKNSMYETFEWSENVKIFTSEIEKVETKEADIYGVGFDSFYSSGLNVENIKIENKNKINILITHGSLDASEKMQLQYNPISKLKLKQVGFDYVALGHIHKTNYNEEENQNIIYPGSTISSGFDELGAHGFIVGNIENENLNQNELIQNNIKEKAEIKFPEKNNVKLEIEFIPVDNKKFEELELDISLINSMEELIEKINMLNLNENNYYKLIFVGSRKFEIELIEMEKYITKENILKIKDETKLEYSLEELKNNFTLKGIFVQEILDEMKKENYTQKELEKILEIGLSVLE